MAKADFCFTYYDGDAARDKAHMNRLERGGYDDLITSQRKFGRLSLALVKKTLGSDFEATWDAIKIVLVQDEAGNFFIEWLDNSLQRMKRQSLKQSENGKKGGRGKANSKANKKPNESQTQSQEKPLGYVYEEGNEDEDIGGVEGKGTEESSLGPPADWSHQLRYPYDGDLFMATWWKWKQYLAEAKKRYNTYTGEQTALEFLGEFPEDVAVEIMKKSMRNSWVNLRPPEAQPVFSNGSVANKSKIDGILDVAEQQKRELEQKYGKQV